MIVIDTEASNLDTKEKKYIEFYSEFPVGSHQDCLCKAVRSDGKWILGSIQVVDKDLNLQEFGKTWKKILV